MKRATFNPKLVRDGIPDLIRAQGGDPIVTMVSTPLAVRPWLIDKVREEIGEYERSGDVAELADVLEVLLALARGHGASIGGLIRSAEVKRAARGGFDLGVIWHGNREQS